MSTVRIQLRRGLEADWTSADTALNSSGGLVLAGGEVGLETDTGKFKFGDGTTRWSTLPYALENTLGDYVLLSEVGQANGVAGLNSSGKVPASQLDISELSQDAVNTALVAGTGISKTYDDNANTITIAVNASTTNISEGTNLYFTDERAQDAVNTALVAGTNVTKSYNDNANTITIDLPAAVNLATSIEAPTAYIDTLNVYETATVADLTVSGNLTVNGTATTVNAVDLVVTDPLIYIGEDNQANSLDLGIVASFNNGTYQHTGLVKDATDGTWRLFSGVVSEPTTVVDFTTYTKDNLQIGALDAVSATIGNVSNTELQYISTVTSNVQDQLGSLDGRLDTIEADLPDYAPLASPTFTGTVSGITKNMVGLGLVDNTDDLSKPISTATQTALSGKAPLDSPTFTGTVSLPSTTSIADVSSTEIGYLNGVTSGIQSQLATLQTNIDAKVSPASPTFTGDVVLPSTTSIGDVSSTEIGYVNGVTSSIQTQIDAKASSTDLSNHSSDTTSIHGIADTSLLATLSDITDAETYADSAVSTHNSDTTSVHGISDTSALATKTYADDAVSTHSSDTTSVHGITDTSKIVLSDAVSTTLDGALIVSGDFTVNGTTFNASATSITIEDNMLQLAHQNAANTVDLGLVVAYNDGAAKHSGIVRDVSDAKWKLFKGVTTEPSTTVDFTQGSLDDLALNNLTTAGVVFTDGTQTKAGVPSITTFATAISSSATLAAGEQDKFIPLTGAVTITLPATGYSTGQSIDFYQASGTGAQFASTNSVVGTPGYKFRTTNSVVTAMKTDSGWLIFGDLSA